MSDTAPESIDFLLLGKTGHGKSSLGNSILRREEFETAESFTSKTQSIDYGWTKYRGYKIKVVDGPGLEDTRLCKLEDKKRACTFIEQALSLCPNGIHVFLLVLKYGDRYTDEDQGVVESLRRILGQDFLKSFTIVVMTRGDHFYDDAKRRKRSPDFMAWVRKETGAMKTLLEECSFRILLFNNREEQEGLEMQLNSLLSMAEQIKGTNRGERYCNEHFERWGKERQKMIIELKAPELHEEFQEQMCLTMEEIQNLNENSTEDDTKRVESLIAALLKRIDEEDKDTGVLSDLRKKVLKLQDAFNLVAFNLKEKKDAKEAFKKLQRQREIVAKASKARLALLSVTLAECIARGLLLGVTTAVIIGSVGAGAPIAAGANLVGQAAITVASIAIRKKINENFSEPCDDSGPKEDK